MLFNSPFFVISGLVVLTLSLAIFLYEESVIARQRKAEKRRQEQNALIVHELRSSLTVMRGTADTILKHAADMDKTTSQTLLQDMFTACDKVLNRISDLETVNR